MDKERIERKVDWDQIRAEYIGGGTTYRELAKKYDVGLTTIATRASDEGWTKDRSVARAESRDLAIRRVAHQASENATKLEYARSLMIDRVVQALEQMPEGIGNRVRQSKTDAEGKTMTIDYDILKLVSALEKLSHVSAGDLNRQMELVDEHGSDGVLDTLLGAEAIVPDVDEQ